MSHLSCLNRQDVILQPDPSRVLVRSFKPATEPRDINPTDKTRAQHIVDRVLALDDAMTERLLEEVLENFDRRHRNLLARFETRCDEMDSSFGAHAPFNQQERRLIGAHFLHEYSFEAAALFNPSIVLHPDQSSAPEGGCRFILSLRGVGEGHISSLTFRTGSLDANGTITIDPALRQAALAKVDRSDGDAVTIQFETDEDLSERVIFPVTPSQSNGIEDARFVKLEGDDRYVATYTAYSGRAIRSEMIETTDFLSFTMRPLSGDAANNKGMALFPRKIGGRYAMIGRMDNENLFLLYSDDLYTWNGGQKIIKPEYPWEFVQIGNCGSPIETDEGWLLFTHGVGAIRKYSIGAVLLDRDDPSKIIARTEEPLIRPEPAQREGYVPNVVYTCGALRHGDTIVLPYAVSDTFSNFATVHVADLIEAMVRC